MTRARKGAARHQAKIKWFNQAKGNRGSRRNCWRRVKETVIRAGANATRHRHLVKQEYRALWITRISAACRMRDMSYSRFICGLKAASIDLNRKMLSEIAIHDPATFDTIVEKAKAAMPGAKAA